MHTEDKASNPTPITKAVGVTSSVGLDPSYHRVDQVAVGIVDARGALHISRR